MLQSMGSQRVGCDLVAEQQQHISTQYVLTISSSRIATLIQMRLSLVILFPEKCKQVLQRDGSWNNLDDLFFKRFVF